jgi:hypothetical protein
MLEPTGDACEVELRREDVLQRRRLHNTESAAIRQ